MLNECQGISIFSLIYFPNCTVSLVLLFVYLFGVFPLVLMYLLKVEYLKEQIK